MLDDEDISDSKVKFNDHIDQTIDHVFEVYARIEREDAMYYKLTMKDNRVVFVPVVELHDKFPAKVIGATDAGRLRQIKTTYPDCIDWEMVEPEEVLGVPFAIPVQTNSKLCTKCKHCGKEVEKTPSHVPALTWIHTDGFFNCGGRPGHAATFAEPI